MVIINADDFGLNESISKAIAEAFSKKLITDTTMMATGAYFDEAVTLAKKDGFFNRIGIHLNLTEGVPLTEKIKREKRFVTAGRFNKSYRRLSPLTASEKRAIEEELRAQIEKLLRSGADITHADSHHHIHTGIFIAPIVVRVCREYGIKKIRLHRNIGQISLVKRLVKNLYNLWLHHQGMITTDRFAYPEDVQDREIPDQTEIMVHPDFDRNGLLINRQDVEDGFPTGEELPDYQAERNVVLKSYTEL